MSINSNFGDESDPDGWVFPLAGRTFKFESAQVSKPAAPMQRRRSHGPGA